MKPYFTIDELCYSQTALRRNIRNRPDADTAIALRQLIDECLTPLRQKFGRAIIVTSGYRCKELNDIIGGARNSQHIAGEAADIVAVSYDMKDNARLGWLAVNMGHFDQIIFENCNVAMTECRWVHISYRRAGNRHQVLRKYAGDESYRMVEASSYLNPDLIN